MSRHEYKWCIMPISGIQDKTSPILAKFRWLTHKSDATAALMVYIALILKINSRPLTEDDVISTRITYSELEDLTSISRAKISEALKLLETFEVLRCVRQKSGNTYQIDAKKKGWAKVPRKLLLNDSEVCKPFKLFNLRSKHELNALKLYLLFLAFRNNEDDKAKIGYDKISEYTGVLREDITKAISHLVNLELISARNSIDSEETDVIEKGHHNIYKIRGLSTLSTKPN